MRRAPWWRAAALQTIGWRTRVFTEGARWCPLSVALGYCRWSHCACGMSSDWPTSPRDFCGMRSARGRAHRCVPVCGAAGRFARVALVWCRRPYACAFRCQGGRRPSPYAQCSGRALGGGGRARWPPAPLVLAGRRAPCCRSALEETRPGRAVLPRRRERGLVLLA